MRSGFSGAEDRPGALGRFLVTRSHLSCWATVAAFGLLAAVFAIPGVLLILSGASASSGAVVFNVGIGILLLNFSVFFVTVAIRVEHGMGIDWADYPSREPCRPAPAGRRGPVSSSVCGLLFAGLTIFAIVDAVNVYRGADLSSYVQAHGARRTATVVSVHETLHISRSSTWYTAELSVTLDRPVAGQTRTTVYYPSSDPAYGVDRTITVLVDPHRPGYAELPGSPYLTASDWIRAALAAVILSGASGWLGYKSARPVLMRLAWRAGRLT
jgi:hypothetical protein